jgi:hypothetical protein
MYNEKVARLQGSVVVAVLIKNNRHRMVRAHSGDFKTCFFLRWKGELVGGRRKGKGRVGGSQARFRFALATGAAPMPLHLGMCPVPASAPARQGSSYHGEHRIQQGRQYHRLFPRLVWDVACVLLPRALAHAPCSSRGHMRLMRSKQSSELHGAWDGSG